MYSFGVGVEKIQEQSIINERSLKKDNFIIMISTPIILLVISAVIVLWAILTYNRLITLRSRTREAWSDIDVQLKRRYNLIPNLVETVKGYATHEREVFEKVTEARGRAMGAQTIKEKGEAENFLSNTLKSLFAVAENYPQLRAAENFLELQRELRDTEDKVQAARRFYNGNVRDLNIKIESFPANVIANTFRFTKMDFFEIEEAASREPVSVKF
ncbi:hypothetical protein LCGC14_0214940 [marine sediment metagenome]|uniref:LemA family protein n=1 Tax=marine sediment metagenome TaxID=412755 RepID=A0A0F9UF51_9ZZZZ